jgi:hypothetical protein
MAAVRVSRETLAAAIDAHCSDVPRETAHGAGKTTN